MLENSVLWRKTVVEIAKQYPGRRNSSHLYVDNAAMQLIKAPRDFDVILAENLIRRHPQRRNGGHHRLHRHVAQRQPRRVPKQGGLYFGLFEPGGGSAPDIAGQGIANPLAQILSVAMMLRHALGQPVAADAIEAAVRKVIEAGFRTGDIWSPGTTRLDTAAMGAAVGEAL